MNKTQWFIHVKVYNHWSLEYNTYFVEKIDFKYSSDYKKLSIESIFLKFQELIYFDILLLDRILLL